VSLILHLSDLHLGDPSEWQYDYTDTFGLNKRGGYTKIDHLRVTLRALGKALRDQERALDAIVIGGDLTNANGEEGFQAFEDMLDQLEESRPKSDRILVVPGNHDADWRVQPGDPAKFKRFLDATRASYHAPLISGLDYDEAELVRLTGSRKKARPILELDDSVILALSSADFCGVREDKTKTPWDALVASYRADDTSADAAAARDQATNDLRRLRVQDMARVEPRQLDALGERITGSSLSIDADEDVRLRIAVLHHPISPVTDREEIKAFETLTNLERVRSFLFDYGFHVVVHGHKHASYLGWDWLLPATANSGSIDAVSAIPRRTLVVASPGDFRPGKIVCRLLETAPDADTPVAGAPRLRIVNVRGVRASQSLNLDFASQCLPLAQPYVGSTDASTPWVVRANTANAAYQQLRDLPTDAGLPRPVISVVEDPTSANELPQNYPQNRDSSWLRDLANWWQLPNPEAVQAVAGSGFNHGERLYGREDAIASAAMALPSSKAIAILVASDEAGHPKRDFPALTAVQLQARRGSDQTFIDAVGIYRKQDLQLWWPVNMFELAHIQKRALLAAAENTSLKPPLVAGRLVAVTTIGIHDTVLPEMAGTVLDRSLDLVPQWPNRLAYLAARPRIETQGEWEEALGDIGVQDGNVVLVPSIGLRRLHEALEMQRDLASSRRGLPMIIKAVEKLADDAGVAAESLKGKPTARTREYWSSQLRSDVAEILKAVRRAVEASSVAWR